MPCPVYVCLPTTPPPGRCSVCAYLWWTTRPSRHCTRATTTACNLSSLPDYGLLEGMDGVWYHCCCCCGIESESHSRAALGIVLYMTHVQCSAYDGGESVYCGVIWVEYAAGLPRRPRDVMQGAAFAQRLGAIPRRIIMLLAAAVACECCQRAHHCARRDCPPAARRFAQRRTFYAERL